MTDILQSKGFRLTLCSIALGMTTMPAFAQSEDEEMEETTGLKAPKRQTAKDNNTLVSVKGIVIDAVTKQPVAGVRVQTLGDVRYTGMTNARGEFEVKVPDFATSLYVTAPRYMAQQVAIKQGDQRVGVSLLSNKFRPMYADGTSYVAYGETGVKDGEMILDNAIQTNLGADVRSIDRSGAIDGGNAMFIRGLNSLNANAQPLIIVDGVEYDMQQDRTTLHLGRSFNMLANISPDDIQSIKVLKNATALYGSRGGNGVILIETKRGHSMATRIDVNLSAGVVTKPSTQTMMNATQYRNYATEMLGTISDLSLPANRDAVFNFLNDDPDGYYYHTYHNNTDWQNEVYETALTQNYSINVQGGDDIGMYNLSVGYADANSTVKETNFNRLNVRFNTDIKILWNFETKFDMSFSRTNNSLFDDGFSSDLSAGTITSPTNLAAIKSPLLAPNQYNKYVGGFTHLLSGYDQLFSPLSEALYDNDYTYSLANPSAIIAKANGDNKNKIENTFFNVHIAPTYHFRDNLSATVDFSYVLNRNSQRYYRPSEGVPPFLVEGMGTVYNLTSSLFAKQTNVLANAHVDWDKKYGAHSVAAFGGFRYNYFSYDGNDASTQFRTSQDDKNPYLTADPSVGFANLKGANDVWKNMQWYVNGDYNYRNRYFATISLLAEANSRFGEKADGGVKMFGTKWAIFPSVQLGWVMTNEEWFPKTSFVDYLRINAGVDMSGNDGISNYAARTAFTSVRYNYNAIGMQLTNIGNDEVKWETTTKMNLGLQANMLNNRLSFGADFYMHKTKDLLTLRTFETPVGGINNYWSNGGELENKGFELSISGKPVATKDLTLEIGASMGHYKNKVKSLPYLEFSDGAKQFNNGDYLTSVYGTNNILVAQGQELGQFYGYQTAGVFASDAEASAASSNGKLYLVDDAGNKQYFGAGDVHFVDQNKDGEINELDKVVIGKANPDLYGNIFATLNWKRFTFDVNFNYSIGNDVYNYQRSILNSGSTFYNQQVAELDHWRYEGQRASLPRLAFGDPMQNNRFSDRWIEDGSYLKLKNMRLTYEIPVPEAWQSWLQNLTVWGEAQNVFTVTKYTGNDPEFSAGNGVLYQGVDAGMLAHSRAFLFGLKINL